MQVFHIREDSPSERTPGDDARGWKQRRWQVNGITLSWYLNSLAHSAADHDQW